MKISCSFFIGAVMTAMIMTSCGGSNNGDTEQTTSKEKGNQTSSVIEVKIGNQVWMAENLNVDKFRNGDPITHAQSDEEWKRAGEEGKPAWCYYDNNPENGRKYGKLYNWYSIIDPRGLAPIEWTIPSDEDWNELIDFLEGNRDAGKKMKSKSGWDKNGNGTNESGFSGLPGGARRPNGDFLYIGESSCWWSSTDDDSLSFVWTRIVEHGSDRVTRGSTPMGAGFSVRCLRGLGGIP